MKIPYKSLAGGAGVSNYEMVDDGMIMVFAGGKYRYVYNSVAPGIVHWIAMKRLAVEGRGLSTYISRFVGKNYARKIPL